MASNLRRSKRTIGRRLSYVESKLNVSRRVNVPRRLGPGAVGSSTLAPDVNSTIQGIQTTADGKNTIYRQSSAPTGGTYAEGDLWFDTSQNNRLNRYVSGSWVAFTLGDNALASISANKITAGTIDASVINVSNLNAGNIVTGAINAGGVEIGYDVGPGTGHYGLSLSSTDFNNIFIKRSDGVYFFRVNAGGANSLQFDSASGVLSLTGSVTASSGTIGGFSLSSSTISASYSFSDIFDTVTGYLTIATSGTMTSNYTYSGIMTSYYTTVRVNDYSGSGQGSVTVEGTASGSYSKYVYSSSGAFNASDIRLKNIVDTDVDALSLLNNVDVVKFTYKNDEKEKVHFGFIAQQINDYIPDAVFVGGEDPVDRPWLVSKEAVIPYTTRAIQQLSKKIDDLESRVKELES